MPERASTPDRVGAFPLGKQRVPPLGLTPSVGMTLISEGCRSEIGVAIIQAMLWMQHPFDYPEPRLPLYTARVLWQSE